MFELCASHWVWLGGRGGSADEARRMAKKPMVPKLKITAGNHEDAMEVSRILEGVYALPGRVCCGHDWKPFPDGRCEITVTARDGATSSDLVEMAIEHLMGDYEAIHEVGS